MKEIESKFNIVLHKDYYIGGIDPYDDEKASASIGVVLSTPRKTFALRKIKGFRRVINIGWNYIYKIVK